MSDLPSFETRILNYAVKVTLEKLGKSGMHAFECGTGNAVGSRSSLLRSCRQGVEAGFMAGFVGSREEIEEKPPVDWPVLAVKITRAFGAKQGSRS